MRAVSEPLSDLVQNITHAALVPRSEVTRHSPLHIQL